MARRKLEGTLTEYEHEDAIVNGVTSFSRLGRPA